MLERSNQQRSFRSRSRNPNATNLVTNFRTAERTVSVSLGKPLTEPRSTSQRVNESTSQRVNESTSQRVNESTSQRVNRNIVISNSRIFCLTRAGKLWAQNAQHI